MDNRVMAEVIRSLAEERWEVPAVSRLSREKPDPFLLLVSTMLSLRTKDEVTAAASDRLFARAASLEEMMGLSEEEIAALIYPVGFYRVKARHLLEITRDLKERFDSQVPDTLEELLSLRGVGRKTANLVLALGFGKDGLCVDTHVHRISNRFGYVRTKNPRETEFALREKLPRTFWADYNTLLVAFGREVCRPVSPRCSRCRVVDLCGQVGVAGGDRGRNIR